jgi:cardiolipin synthase
MARLQEILIHYWPHLLLVISIAASAVASVHAAMTKQDVRAAIAWVGVIIFSPIFGALLYLVAGINRIRKERVSARRAHTLYDQAKIDKIIVHDVVAISGTQFASLKILGDHVSDFNVLGANQIKMLNGGDETYPAMLEAIRQAQRSIVLQSYIFDHDTVGQELAQALIEAHHRGIRVRVLIDAVGSKYSHPPITALLRNAGVPTALFMRPVIGMRLVYANLRSHRKLLAIDGLHGFTGGMNIRQGFVTAIAKEAVTHDTHFQVSGPIVYQLMTNFAHDWEFTTNEKLSGAEWYAPSATEMSDTGVALRCVPSGPDATLASTHNMLLGALAVAQKHVRIQSPYLLPDMALIAALATTARRGVIVDVVVPGANNLKLVNAAMMAQIDQLIMTGCRVWRASGTFGHSKLFTVDGGWSYIGSSNIDPRSLRLNFELDLEVYDRRIAKEIEAKVDAIIAQAERITLDSVNQDPFWVRLRNKIVWLASPYL